MHVMRACPRTRLLRASSVTVAKGTAHLQMSSTLGSARLGHARLAGRMASRIRGANGVVWVCAGSLHMCARCQGECGVVREGVPQLQLRGGCVNTLPLQAPCLLATREYHLNVPRLRLSCTPVMWCLCYLLCPHISSTV
jgi:hypothetical protein